MKITKEVTTSLTINLSGLDADNFFSILHKLTTGSSASLRNDYDINEQELDLMESIYNNVIKSNEQD